ncbi:unnamed protein product [Meloidogyne enterolobii]|uniref:Uncharacterized protein n=1 Tax=Meloidogyne enterolobii TaxID=390850 RepID=A0ACB0Z1U8_MELEN
MGTSAADDDASSEVVSSSFFSAINKIASFMPSKLSFNSRTQFPLHFLSSFFFVIGCFSSFCFSNTSLFLLFSDIFK